MYYFARVVRDFKAKTPELVIKILEVSKTLGFPWEEYISEAKTEMNKIR